MFALLFIILTLAFMPAQALAQTAPEELVVIGVTPTPGGGLPESKIPYNIQSATADELGNSQSLDVSDFLNRNFLSITINEAQNNPLQPDIQYRGFTASPLLGLAQGITVHQNGVRINEPLGDTANWDLLPESAIHSINLIGGANPLFGLNTLGGSLAVEMKDGYNAQGNQLKIYGGSHGRIVGALESGGTDDAFAYYGNIHYFSEDGWRELSDSDSINLYGSIGWRGTATELNLNLQHGASDLTGNGPLPEELLVLDRAAVFTAPDITENNMYMVSADFSRALTTDISVSGNGFYRQNSTDSFNGDASEFVVCALGNGVFLLDGIERDNLEELGLDKVGICRDNLLNAADPAALETGLNSLLLPGMADFNLEDLTGELSGTGELADAAINNISNRRQQSYGMDIQGRLGHDLSGFNNQLVAGLGWYTGKAEFVSRLELAELDPFTRSTLSLGTGTFVDEAYTHIKTESETVSLYFTDTIDLGEKLALTVSGRFNHTQITLADQTGDRPELNGQHSYSRFNPAVGMTYQATPQLNLYAGYSESSRTPTPIELACNDFIFDLAVASAVAAGEDPDNVEFECRLPNAFLADPPLQQVVATSYEFGIRGTYQELGYHLGAFHTTNENDIIFQTTGRATGLFANVDKTRRAGFESNINGRWNNLSWFAAYSYIRATFADSFTVLSPNHPHADADGLISVADGDSIPGIPEHQFKFGADYFLTGSINLGLELLYNSAQYLRGDESNRLAPVDAYALVNLRGSYRLNNTLEFFARINNIFDSDYETFGLLGESPREADIPLFETYTNPRFLGPGAPRTVFAGIRLAR